MADLFLAFVRLDRNFRFRSAGFRFCFCFIEQAHLFFRVHDFLGFRLAAKLSLAQPFDLLAQLFVLCFQRRFLRGFVINLLYHKTAENPSVYAVFRLFYKTVFGVIFCTARGCSTDSPSMSQRYCCGVSSRTSSGVLGHCSLPFSKRL